MRPRWNHNCTIKRGTAELSTPSSLCVIREGSQPAHKPLSPELDHRGNQGQAPFHPSVCDGGTVAWVAPALIHGAHVILLSL